MMRSPHAGGSSHLSRPTPAFTFIAPPGFATLRLAYMLDSLVRVSRRVGWSHFVNIWSVYVTSPGTVVHRSPTALQVVRQHAAVQARLAQPESTHCNPPQSGPRQSKWSITQAGACHLPTALSRSPNWCWLAKLLKCTGPSQRRAWSHACAVKTKRGYWWPGWLYSQHCLLQSLPF